MEFKSYSEVDVNETPIAVLGCGHFFTAETLDGLVGMGNVYTTDKLGAYNGLRELSGELTAVPTCPDCRIPIRQFATRRYNRVINKAVLDETSKRFLVSGRQRLDTLQKLVAVAEQELADSRADTASAYLDLRKPRPDRHTDAIKLEKETAKLRQEMGAEHQPTKKLFDAVLTFQRREKEQQSLSQKVQHLTISQPTAHPTAPQPVYDQQITLGAHRLQLRIQEAMLRDIFTLLSKCKRELVPALIPGGPPDRRSAGFLLQCADLIPKATAAKLPRLVSSPPPPRPSAPPSPAEASTETRWQTPCGCSRAHGTRRSRPRRLRPSRRPWWPGRGGWRRTAGIGIPVGMGIR